MRLDECTQSDALCIDLIRRELDTHDVGFQTLLYQEVDSTVGALRALAEVGAPEGTVVLAEAQRAGRGRTGQPWFSPPGVNVHAAVLFRPRIARDAVPVFALVAPLAVCDAIRAQGVAAATRWPNDVLIEGRKVGAGMAASATTGARVEYVILAVGVNLNVTREALREALGAAADSVTSVHEAAGRPIDRNVFTAAFLNLLEKWVDIYRTDGPTAVLGAWRARDALVGRRVVVRSTAEIARGLALGVNVHGELVLETAPGVVRAIPDGQAETEA